MKYVAQTDKDIVAAVSFVAQAAKFAQVCGQDQTGAARTFEDVDDTTEEVCAL